MHVFLTGASGFVGREVLRQLITAGHQVRVLVRRKIIPPPGTALPECHVGDVTNAPSLAGALRGIDAVIHLVGIISECGATTFERVHVEGTRNMALAAKDQQVRRYIQMSALGTRPNAVSRYHQTKWRAEEFVRSSGLDFTIFRPSLIFGPEDHFVNLFAAMSRLSPVLPLMGRRDAKLQPVAVESVAQAFVGALAQPATIGRTLDLCGPDRLTLAEILGEILKATGRKRLLLPVPIWAARTQAFFLEWLYPTLFRQAPPLNRAQLQMLQEDNVGDEKPAEALLGLRPVKFREGLVWLQ